MSTCAYFWKNNELVLREIPPNWAELIAGGLADVLSVDLAADDGYGRYGMYVSKNRQWKHIPLEDFPSDMRVHMLLLGVT